MSDKLQVITDMLRELGLEREATWVEQREHVATLLKLNPATGYDNSCESCMSDSGSAHSRMCGVAAAWRALGDPRGAEDIEWAHEEALARAPDMERWANSPPGALFPSVAVDPNLKAGQVLVFSPQSIVRIVSLESPGTLQTGSPTWRDSVRPPQTASEWADLVDAPPK